MQINNHCTINQFTSEKSNIRTMAITLYLTVLTKEIKNVVLVIVGFLILTYTLKN